MADLVAAMSVTAVTDETVTDRVIDYMRFVDRETRVLTDEALKKVVEGAVGSVRRPRLIQLLTNRAAIEPERAEAVADYLLCLRKSLDQRSRSRPLLSTTGTAGRPAGAGRFDALTTELAISKMVLEGVARKTACRDASLMVAGRTPDADARETIELAAGEHEADAGILARARRVESRLKGQGDRFVRLIAELRSAITTDDRVRRGFEAERADLMGRLPDKAS